jgi:hypothetical protein
MVGDTRHPDEVNNIFLNRMVLRFLVSKEMLLGRIQVNNVDSWGKRTYVISRVL